MLSRLVLDERLQRLGIVRRNPARQRRTRRVSHITSRPYSSLSRTRSTSSCSGPTTPTSAGEPSCGRNTCTTPSSAICCSASFSFFAFMASGSRTRRRISGAKLGTPTKLMSSPSVSVSPIAHRAVVGDADHVAGIGLVGDRAVLREEELRRVERDRLAGAHLLDLHAAGELARAQPRERDAVAVVRVHVGLDLEHEGRHAWFSSASTTRLSAFCARGGGAIRPIASSRSPTPKFFSAEPKNTGRQMPLAERLQIERLAGVAHQLELAGDRATRRDWD